MDKIYGVEYLSAKDWILTKRKEGETWEFIEKIDDGFLESGVSYWGFPPTIKDDWPALIDEMKDFEKRKKNLVEITKRGTIVGTAEKNELEPSENPQSCWQLYKKRLLAEKDFSQDSVDMIEAECKNILSRLSLDTSGKDPIKGLVIGNVQSGKTANMAGLISMSADSGWNFFIVLSGSIDKLRQQTRDRLYEDLNNEQCSLNWQKFDHLDKSNRDAIMSQLDFKQGSVMRYLTVCLKNSTRLKNLLAWINSDEKKKGQLKILFIDDEADQASVNTADLEDDEERKAVNGLIVKTINCRNNSGEIKGKYGSMNYVSYTATPYANFLSDGTPPGLFPRDFIAVLTPSNIYFGPKEIYGLEKKEIYGMDIINCDISPEEEIEPVHNGKTDVLPNGLKDSVCWFLCITGAMRKQGYKRPISMLVHTSHLTDQHMFVADAINKYLTGDSTEIIDRCRCVYEAEKEKMSLKKFRSQYPNYGIKDQNINDYPSFSDISAIISELIGNPPKHIEMTEDKEIKWGQGIHLCIDNSKKIPLIESENAIPRLVYPSVDMIPAPAFIVVGGNTLSRGLTIEGLVSTYFARITTLGDTLMQMGRWFGYRKGYELYPRIWMSTKSYDDFAMLAEVDEELRDFVRNHYSVITPEEFPPIVRKFPKVGYIRTIVAREKSRFAVETGYDFRGSFTETCSFDITPQVLEENYQCAKNYLRSLGKPSAQEIKSSCVVWRDVPGEHVFDEFFSKYVANKRSSFNEIGELKKWIGENSSSQNWNIILAGLESESKGEFVVSDDVRVYNVERSAISDTSGGQAHLKSLSTPQDRYADIQLSHLNEEGKALFEEYRKDSSNNWQEIRKIAGIDEIPVLMIYCIAHDSQPKQKDGITNKNRHPLNAEKDVIGISVIIPGFKGEKKVIPQYLKPVLKKRE